jgi:hypothetical protein
MSKAMIGSAAVCGLLLLLTAYSPLSLASRYVPPADEIMRGGTKPPSRPTPPVPDSYVA